MPGWSHGCWGHRVTHEAVPVPFDFCFHAGKHCGLQENQHEISNTGAVCLAP